jgi:two-component system nitrogen regulation response regulator GlnG
MNLCRRLTVTAAGREVVAADLPGEFAGATRERDDDWTARLGQWADEQVGNDSAPALLEAALPQFERTLILAALKKAHGKRLEAAKLLGWGRNTLTRKIKELGLDES